MTVLDMDETPFDMLQALRSRLLGQVEQIGRQIRYIHSDAQDLGLDTALLRESMAPWGRWRHALSRVCLGEFAAIEDATRAANMGAFAGMDEAEVKKFFVEVRDAEPERILMKGVERHG